MYNHVVLHPSQQLSDPPRVKRNLVRKIVAQFNEEARQRERLRRQHSENDDVRDTSPYRSSSPPVIEATPESAPNNNKPFSYTSQQPPAFLHRKSKSEHDLKSPDEIIYAQVIVNGHTDKGVPNKTTVHTKVSTKNGLTNNHLERKSSMNRNHSVSMVNLQGKNAKADIKPIMTHRKYVANEQHLNSYEYARSPSPDVSYTASSIKKHHKDRKKDIDSRRINGDISTGHKDQYIFSDSSFYQNASKETENANLLRENRKDKIKRDSSLSRKEVKDKMKTAGREQIGRKTTDHTWDKSMNFSHKISSKENGVLKGKDDNRTSSYIDSRSRRRLEDEYDNHLETSDDKGVVFSEQSSSRHKEDRDINGGHEEIEHKTWSSTKQMINGNLNDIKDRGRFEIVNGNVDPAFRVGEVTNIKKTEYTKEEKVVRRHRTSSGSSSPIRDDSPSGKQKKEKSLKKEAVGKTSKQAQNKQKILTETTSTSKRSNAANDPTSVYNMAPMNLNKKEAEKKFYYFGANEADINLNIKTPAKEKSKHKNKEKENTVLSSTKLVKEANAKVVTNTQKEKVRNPIISSTPTTKSPERIVTESPIGSGNHDSGYSSRMGMSSPPQNKTVSPSHTTERIINIEVEGRKDNYHQYHQHHHHHHQNKNLHRHEHVTSAFADDIEERMETSESDDMPNQWGFGSQESQMSGPSNQWSSLEEEDDENIVAVHVNTPQSIVREMDKREISYENSQRSQDKTYNSQLWFERTEVDSDYRKELSTSGTTADHAMIRNDNHVNNNLGSSATMSRIETNKNRINSDTTHRSATLDRRHQQNQQNQQNRKRNANSPSTAVRILLNGRDITDEEDSKDVEGNSIHARQSSRTGSYPSETESQHSNKSKGSRKSSGSSPVSKRVNFKTRSKAKRSVSSAANLSPVHREALMRASSPIRPPSANGSLNSSGSEASNKSVILHATTVADIPPARSYRYRIYRDSSSPSGSRNGSRENGRSGKAVTRTFSLLAPWKPKKYKQKYEQRYENNKESQLSTTNSTTDKNELKVEKDSQSHNSSSEKLDSLSPLPSEKPKSHDKRVTVVRHNSMPKDTRFTGFFKKKKEYQS